MHEHSPVLRSVGSVLIACLLVGAAYAGRDEHGRLPLELDKPITAELPADAAPITSPELALLTDGSPVGVRFAVTVEKSGEFTLSGHSHFFDTHLILRDATGQLLAEDDDGGLRTHSRITATLRTGQTYEVTLVSRRATPGRFTVALAAGAPAPLTDAEVERATFEDARAEIAAWSERYGTSDDGTIDRIRGWGSELFNSGYADEAVATLERALDLRQNQHGEDAFAVTDDLLGLAAVQYQVGLPNEAELNVLRAIAIAESHESGREFVLTGLEQLVLIQLDRYDLEAARTTVGRMTELARAEGEESLWLGNALTSLGYVQYLGQQFDAARETTLRALEIQSLHLDPSAVELAPTYNQAGMLCDAVGDYEGAILHFERALAINEVHYGSDHPETASVLNNLAVSHSGCGRYEEALDFTRRALAIEEAVYGSESVGVAHLVAGIAMIAFYQRKYDEAELHYERAVQLIERIHGPKSRELAHVLKNYAGVHLARMNYAKARDLTTRGMEAAGYSPTDDLPAAASYLSDLGTAHYGLGRFDEARAHFERALEIMERHVGSAHLDVAVIHANLGRVARRTGNLEAAVTFFERAAAIYAELPGRGQFGQFDNEEDLITTYLDLRRVDRALATAERAVRSVRENSTVRYALASESDALVYAVEHQRAIQLFLSASRLGGGSASDRYAEVLRWKSRVARTYQQSKASLFSRVSPEEKEVLAKIRQLQGQISGWVAAPDGADPVRGRKIEGARTELRRLERALDRTVGFTLSTPDPTLSALQAALPENSIWIDLVEHRVYEPSETEGSDDEVDTKPKRGRLGPSQLTAWIVPKGGELIEVALGPTAPLRDAVAQLPAALGSVRGLTLPKETKPQRFETVQRRIRDQLWKPIEAHVTACNATTVFVCSYGFLTALPFEILKRDDQRFLIEEHTFIYPRDAAAVIELGGPAPTSVESPSLLVVGGVDYAGDKEAVKRSNPAPSSAARPTWAPLPGTAREAAAVAALHSERFQEGTRLELTKDRATESRLKRELARFSVVHLATHGYFQPEVEAASDRNGSDPETFRQVRLATRARPSLRSGLVCANANLPKPGDNGLLTAEEVAWLDLRGCELVVLSACETALGSAQVGEGLMSLRRSFLQSGAKSVISSLWKVDDNSTETLMREFYHRRWLRGESKIEALRGAQLTLLRRQRESGQAPQPAHWGAFVLTGDWR